MIILRVVSTSAAQVTASALMGSRDGTWVYSVGYPAFRNRVEILSKQEGWAKAPAKKTIVGFAGVVMV